MATGADGSFSDGQVRDISRAVATASAETGLHFSVFVGTIEGDDAREYAKRLHTALGRVAPRGVLILVAPTEQQLEIVTGRESARRLDDRACHLAALSMTTSFTGGDLAGGVVTGLRMMAEAAGRDIAAQLDQPR